MTTTLTDKITKDAAATAAQIKTTAAAEVAAIERETEAERARLQETHATALEKEKAHRERVALSKAKQAGKIAVQQAKRDHLNAIFAEAASSIATAATADYVAFFTAYAQSVLPADVSATNLTGPKDRETETLEIGKALGLAADFETGAMQAGLIVRTKDGVYDVTLERLLSERRADLEVELMNAVNAS